jgi:large subunit ribosomal protein L24
MAEKIKKGDMVEVLSGNDRGKRGKVLRVLTDKGRALVEKVNVVKRHMKPSETSQGGIVEKELSINMSNLGVVCESCDTPVRVKMKVLEDGKKIRACVKCDVGLDK